MTVKVAVVAPAGTVTVAGTDSGSFAVKATTAPPAGAGAVSTMVPVSDTPPTTVLLLRATDFNATLATVSVGDCAVVPPLDAENVAVPAETPVTVNVPVEAPAATVTGDVTVATAALLLVTVTLTAAAADEASVTVPCALPPTPMVVAPSVTLDTFTPFVGVGEEGDDDPQPQAARTRTDAAAMRETAAIRAEKIPERMSIKA